MYGSYDEVKKEEQKAPVIELNDYGVPVNSVREIVTTICNRHTILPLQIRAVTGLAMKFYLSPKGTFVAIIPKGDGVEYARLPYEETMILYGGRGFSVGRLDGIYEGPDNHEKVINYLY